MFAGIEVGVPVGTEGYMFVGFALGMFAGTGVVVFVGIVQGMFAVSERGRIAVVVWTESFPSGQRYLRNMDRCCFLLELGNFDNITCCSPPSNLHTRLLINMWISL